MSSGRAVPLSARSNVVIFWVVQASALLALAGPFTRSLLALCAGSYALRMLGITVGFHRLLAHGAFRTSRPVRFFWALLGTAAMQKGPLWWAGHHVYHHRNADREGDPHSPLLFGFYHSHQGWFLDDVRHDTIPSDNPVVAAHANLPEIRWLERFYAVPPLLLVGGLALWGGWPFVVWGFCLPTVLLAHATFSINSVNHLYGTRRFATSDGSRNNPLTALLTMGEGWHNNHHRVQSAARNGFYWWEPDPAYWTIRLMAALGLAWDVRPVPAHVYDEAAESDEAGLSVSPAAR